MRHKSARIFFVLALFLVVSLACQTAAPVSNLFTTPTPTFTITPSPTLTPTITPTSTPTITPSSTPRPTGIHFDETSRGIQVTDYDSGYLLLLSYDWFLIPADKDLLREAIQDLSSSEPAMADTLRNMELLNDNSIRMISMNRNPSYRNGDLMTNLIAISIQDPMLGSFPMDLFVEITAEQMGDEMPHVKVLDSGVRINENKVEYGYITMDTRVNQRIRPINARQTLIVIKAGTTVTFFSLTLPDGLSDKSAALVDEIADSLYLLDTFPSNDG
jgi:hypothetical protein